MKNATKPRNRKNAVEELHWESAKWKSQFLLMQDELLFIDRLLNSYVFEPNTPNLFERLFDYRERIKKITERKEEATKKISRHESELGGMLECADRLCDELYYKNHDRLREEAQGCLSDFQTLKSEIFNYAGSILKKHKPDKKTT